MAGMTFKETNNLNNMIEKVRYALSLSKKHQEKFNSYPEGYAVLLSKMDSLWDEVRKRRPEHSVVIEEATTIAAMAIKLIEFTEGDF